MWHGSSSAAAQVRNRYGAQQEHRRESWHGAGRGEGCARRGAGGGIGGAGALGLGREGAAVVCADIDAAAAEATAAQISAAGGRAAALDLDVRDRSFVDSTIAATVREFGRLDVLLDCVGVSQTAAFLDIDPGEWERVIAVNLTGMFHLGQQAARQMVRQGAGGSIINVTSQLAEVAAPSVPPMSPRRAAAGR